MSLSWFLARRLLWQGQGGFASFIIRLAVIATALGVAVMVLALVIIAGFKQTIAHKLHAFWGEGLVVPATANIAAITPTDPVRLDDHLLQTLRQQPGVTACIPFVLQTVILQANGNMEGQRLKGVGEDYRPSAGMTIRGNLPDLRDSAYSHDVLLSTATAAKLSLQPGDSLFLYFIEFGNATPRARKMRLSGVYHTGLEELDQQFGICDMRLLQRLAGWEPDEITGYQINAPEMTHSERLLREIDRAQVPRPLKAYPISTIYEGLFSWLKMQDMNGIVLLVIISIVAIINLTAALLLLLADRTSMIAVLKALGIRPRELRRTFVWLGTYVGLLGVGIGLVLGLGIALAQQYWGFLRLPETTYYMDRVPVHVIPWQIFGVALGMPLLSLLCMGLPALYTNRIRPASVLSRG